MLLASLQIATCQVSEAITQAKSPNDSWRTLQNVRVEIKYVEEWQRINQEVGWNTFAITTVKRRAYASPPSAAR